MADLLDLPVPAGLLDTRAEMDMSDARKDEEQLQALYGLETEALAGLLAAG